MGGRQDGMSVPYDLSIVIPARHEEFLNRTVQDILQNRRSCTQVIVGLDGEWPIEPIEAHPDAVVLHYPESIGQRAITNKCVALSQAKYVMKTDAHVAFDEGFDAKLLADMQPDWAMVPLMRNLHAFDWVCPQGHRRYQGRSGPCGTCGEPTTKELVWRGKENPQSAAYCFDSEPHFQYFREYSRRPEGRGDLTESMSLQGSCFLVERDLYWRLNLCDEAFGSWGSQGIEVACKVWLSGGKVMVNRKTWYAHLFRTQGGDFGFPYPNPDASKSHAQQFAKDLFFNNKWDKAVHPLSWLVEKFWPIPGWTDKILEELKRSEGIK